MGARFDSVHTAIFAFFAWSVVLRASAPDLVWLRGDFVVGPVVRRALTASAL